MAYRQNRPAELDLELMRKYAASIPRPPSSVYSNDDELEVTPTYVDGLLRNSSSTSERFSGSIGSFNFPMPQQPQQQQYNPGNNISIGKNNNNSNNSNNNSNNNVVAVNASLKTVSIAERASSGNETDVSSVKELSWYNNRSGIAAESSGLPIRRPKPVYRDMGEQIQAMLMDPEAAIADTKAFYKELAEQEFAEQQAIQTVVPHQDANVTGGPFHNLPGSVRVVPAAAPLIQAEQSQTAEVRIFLGKEKVHKDMVRVVDKFENLNLDLLSDDDEDDEDEQLPIQKNSNTKIQALLGIGIDYPVQVQNHKKSASKSSITYVTKTNAAATADDQQHRPWPSLNVRGKAIKTAAAIPPPRPPRSPPIVASKPIMVPGSSFRNLVGGSYGSPIENQPVQRAVPHFYPNVSNSGQPSPAMSSDTGSTIPDTNFISPSTPTTPSTSPGAHISRFGEDSVHDELVSSYYTSGYSREGDTESMESDYFIDDMSRHSALHTQPLPYPRGAEQITGLVVPEGGYVELERESVRHSTAIFDINEDQLALPDRDDFKPIKVTSPWFAFPDEYIHPEGAMESIRHQELDRLARLPETTEMIAQAEQPASTLKNPLPPIALPPLHAPLHHQPLDSDEPPIPESPSKIPQEVVMSSRWSDYSSDEDDKPASRWRRSMKSHARTASSSSGAGVKVDFNLKKNVSKALKMKRRAAVPSSATFGSEHSTSSGNSNNNKRSSYIPPTPAIDLRNLRVSYDSDNESQTTRAPDSWGPTTHLAPTPPPLRFLPEAKVRPPTSAPTSAPSRPKTNSNGKSDEKGSKKALKTSKSFGTAQESGRSTPTTQLRSSKSTFEGWSMAASKSSTKNSQSKAPKLQYGMWI